MILPSGTIILVTDGARMLLLRNAGDAVNPDLQVVEHRQYESIPNRELETDSLGVSFSSGSQHRHTYDEGNPHESKEARFIGSAADALDEIVGDVATPVIVVAPPPALGILRRAYSARIRKALRAEFDKDFTQLSVTEIAHRLAALEQAD